MKLEQSHSVLIAHPERQHSHQLAAALNECKMLGKYYHGAALPSYVTKDIARNRRKRIHWFQPLRRGLPLVLPRKKSAQAYNAMLSYYDRFLARRLPIGDCNAVIGYESSSLHTFKAAKRLGLACILDAANVHHSMQASYLPEANDEKSVSIKDREIDLADLIITCSSFAAESYIAAGVPPEKIRAVALGVETKIFSGQELKNDSQTKDTASITFCNAGILDRRKGMDLLSIACKNLQANGYDFQMLIAGNKSDAEPELIQQLEQYAHITPRFPHTKLPCFYRQADVFILPSLFDSFGMVVTEALACGLPVIVTQNVGAKDMVTEGVNGWIIPANDVDALYERMAWCVNNPQAVRAMSVAARESAMARNWDAYRREVAQVVSDFLDEHRTLAA